MHCSYICSTDIPHQMKKEPVLKRSMKGCLAEALTSPLQRREAVSLTSCLACGEGVPSSGRCSGAIIQFAGTIIDEASHILRLAIG